jgi:hypothetical protein
MRPSTTLVRLLWSEGCSDAEIVAATGWHPWRVARSLRPIRSRLAVVHMRASL